MIISSEFLPWCVRWDKKWQHLGSNWRVLPFDLPLFSFLHFYSLFFSLLYNHSLFFYSFWLLGFIPLEPRCDIRWNANLLSQLFPRMINLDQKHETCVTSCLFLKSSEGNKKNFGSNTLNWMCFSIPDLIWTHQKDSLTYNKKREKRRIQW